MPERTRKYRYKRRSPFFLFLQLAKFELDTIEKFLALTKEAKTADPALAAELSAAPVNLGVLGELMLWNKRLAADPARDRIGRAATLFWAVQTLVTTVMRSSALIAHEPTLYLGRGGVAGGHGADPPHSRAARLGASD